MPVAVVGGSPGMFGAVWAQADLRRALGLAGARVVDRELPVPSIDEALTDDHKLVEPAHATTLSEILAELVEAIETRRAITA